MDNFDISQFYCTKCANRIDLPRKTDKRRKKGHLKKVYCIKCKEEVNHYEVRNNDLDFNLNEFKQQITEGDFLYENI